MRDLSQAQLKRLYFDFCTYRDVECGGSAKLSVEAFYGKFKALYH